MRGRTALVTSVALAVLLAGFVLVLATRDPATTRVAKSRLLGRPAPAVVGPSMLGGAPFDLAAEQGRFVLVNFFATWCIPCIEEHDDLVAFSEAHDEAGDATVVSIVFSDEASEVERFFARRGGDWPVLDDADGSIATAFGVTGVPESYLVAPDGRVVLKLVGGIRFAELEELFAGAVERWS
jgi:cytochrome c biogenesis protein CcmG, thiol:disulfide interchange protein DsbE